MEADDKPISHKRILLGFAGLLALLPFSSACQATGEGQAGLVIHERFEDPPKMSMLPHGWVIAETAARGTPASWGRSKALHGFAFAVLNSKNVGQTFNLAILDGPRMADFEASLAVKAIKGAIDQGGGLCWRLQDPDNYYIARWNPLEDNLRLYIVQDGKRSQLAGESLKADPSKWHTLAVEMRGIKITLSFDGATILEHEDARIKRAGCFGLWTKADASTAFDDLVVRN